MLRYIYCRLSKGKNQVTSRFGEINIDGLENAKNNIYRFKKGGLIKLPNAFITAASMYTCGYNVMNVNVSKHACAYARIHACMQAQIYLNA